MLLDQLLPPSRVGDVEAGDGVDCGGGEGRPWLGLLKGLLGC